MEFSTIRLEQEGYVVHLTLNRPEVRNALNAQMISELHQAVDALTADPPRVVVLRGEGALFCAGADAKWMVETGAQDWDANYADALAMADLLAALDSLSCAVLAGVKGGAYGGGIGLLACCDAVVAADSCVFAFGEVRLGLAPATIAPYVCTKIGASAARELFLNAARFDARHAQSVGVVHEVVAESELESALERRISEYLACSPNAVAAGKRLIAEVVTRAKQREQTARLIAELRASPEGREGLAAFLERRKPSWAQ